MVVYSPQTTYLLLLRLLMALITTYRLLPVVFLFWAWPEEEIDSASVLREAVDDHDKLGYLVYA